MTGIEDFINAVVDKNYAKSNEMFSDLIGQKIDHALDAEKAAMANVMFNDADPDEDFDVSDEDLEEFLDEDDIDLDDEEEDEDF
jgi:hypothetical protein